MVEIHLFKSGNEINDGDHLIATVDESEGHRRVTLRVVEK